MISSSPTPLAPPRAVSRASDPAYLERVYAGVLGKIIGVYLGRPVENWSYEKIAETFGTIEGYVHEQRARNLVVTDDDISGTFTFLRALEDYGYDRNLTPAQIGRTWLNYLIEGKTILWWGGMGNSTEHTAYLRLKHGIEAPRSGSSALNTPIMAEQIGAQIFIDGWGFVAPGDPEFAADLARRAASVSHDGEAVHAAVVVATMVAQAFVEHDLDRLLDTALRHIPSDSIIARLIGDLRAWHAAGSDWRSDRARLEAEYGYDKYPGNCHVVPNHGLIVLSLLHSGGDFSRALSIVNSCGWDTDCNSGNVGAIMGVRGGLAAIGEEWRGPVADRLYLPSADGGRAITDALRESIAVANAGRRLIGEPSLAPKDGARFHFGLPGAVQGWTARDASVVRVSNPTGDALRLERTGSGETRVATATFIPREAKDVKTGYVLVANPTLYSGQKAVFDLRGVGPSGASGRLFVTHYGEEEEAIEIVGPAWTVAPGGRTRVEFPIPVTGGQPIYEIGTTLESGAVEIERLDWTGIPETEFPKAGGTMWARAWANSLHRFEAARDGYSFLTHNDGIGLLTQGHREWRDYRVEATLIPRMAVSAGLAVRVQGMQRYYALIFGEAGEIRLEKHLDGRRTLARTSFPWEAFHEYAVEIEVRGAEIRAWIDGRLKLTAVDSDAPLLEGAFGFVVEAGCLGSGTPKVSPA